MKPVCAIPNCGKVAPVNDAFCFSHSDKHERRTYAFCCNGDHKHCDCVDSDHGTAFYRKATTGAAQ